MEVKRKLFKSTTDYTTVNQFYWSGEEQGLSTK